MKTFVAVLAAGLFSFAGTPSTARADPPPIAHPSLAGQPHAGFLAIASDPPAKIIVDGVDTGRMTPQAHLELAPGHHKLTLETADHAHKRTIGVSIEAGETTKLTVHLAS